jgi:hypothetical protein
MHAYFMPQAMLPGISGVLELQVYLVPRIVAAEVF